METKAMTTDEMKDLFKDKDSETIAMVIMDTTMKVFSEDNFYYYDYSIQMAYRVSKLVKDGIITKNKGAKVHKQLSKLLNRMIRQLIDSKGDLENEKKK